MNAPAVRRPGRAVAFAVMARVGLLEPVLAVVFPSRCPACAAPLAHPSRGPLCGGCWASLPVHRGPACGCGLSLAEAAGGTCGRCRRGLTPFRAGASLGPFTGSLRSLLHELKFRGRRRVATRLAEVMLGRDEVRRALASQRECLKLLDAKIDYYADCLALAPQATWPSWTRSAR